MNRRAFLIAAVTATIVAAAVAYVGTTRSDTAAPLRSASDFSFVARSSNGPDYFFEIEVCADSPDAQVAFTAVRSDSSSGADRLRLAVDWNGMDNNSAAAGELTELPQGFVTAPAKGRVAGCDSEQLTALAIMVTRTSLEKTTLLAGVDVSYTVDGDKFSVRFPGRFGVCGAEEPAVISECE